MPDVGGPGLQNSEASGVLVMASQLLHLDVEAHLMILELINCEVFVMSVSSNKQRVELDEELREFEVAHLELGVLYFLLHR